jgi:hypothetical protein
VESCSFSHKVRCACLVDIRLLKTPQQISSIALQLRISRHPMQSRAPTLPKCISRTCSSTHRFFYPNLNSLPSHPSITYPLDLIRAHLPYHRPQHIACKPLEGVEVKTAQLGKEKTRVVRSARKEQKKPGLYLKPSRRYRRFCEIRKETPGPNFKTLLSHLMFASR